MASSLLVENGTMSPILLLLLAGSAFAELQSQAISEEIQARVEIVRLWAGDPILVDTVVRANAAALSQAEIEQRDRVWQATAGIDSFMQELLDNAGSTRLLELGAGTPELGEAFLTDHRGANVAMTRKTSDYWQGDEDKFLAAFTGRADAFHVDPVQFDESIQAYAVQISVPVVKGGVPVGVLVVTVNLERLVEGF